MKSKSRGRAFIVGLTMVGVLGVAAGVLAQLAAGPPQHGGICGGGHGMIGPGAGHEMGPGGGHGAAMTAIHSLP